MDTEEYHTCHFCGTSVNQKGYEGNGERHFLSDCRPDLVEHEIGDICTWAFRRKDINLEGLATIFPENYICYAYEDKEGNWTSEHIHFYKDGPM